MDKQKQKPRITPEVYVVGRQMDVDGLRTMAQRDSVAFAQRTQELIDQGELRWDKVRDVRGLFHKLDGISVPAAVNVAGETRAIQASAFPLLAGGMTIAGIQEAYAAVPAIGGELVTDTEDNKRVSIYAGITSEDLKIDRVDEAKDFPEIGAGEEKFEIRSNRNGRRISITAEMIEENDVPNIVERVNALGEIAGETVEQQTLRRVTDHTGSAAVGAEPYALRPNGVGTALYNSTAGNPGVRATNGTRVLNNALVDETDLEAARARLVSMRNSLGARISIPMSRCILLVPDALAGTAAKLTNSEYQPGVENELNNWGPRGMYRPRVLSTPKLDDLSTSAWYLGDFKRQFKRKWKLRFEYVTLTTDTESFLKSRIAFQARVAWDVEIGAVDYVYVVQCLSAATAPADE
mgnify:CR=1 FL=1